MDQAQRFARDFGVSSDHFALVRDLLERGGPSREEHGLFVGWLNETAELIRRGELYLPDVHLFWTDLGDQYLDGCLQGRVLARRSGYAGDFAIMEDIYRYTIATDPRFQNWDLFFQGQAAPRAVRNRPGYFHAVVAAAARRSGREPRVLVLGCGPARDIATCTSAVVGSRARFVAVDRDARALARAREICTEHGVDADFVSANVVTFDPDQRFDVIWSAGLFDYLSDRLFVRLVRRYARSLSPTGQIVIGNFQTHSTRNYMELVGNWSLNYRTAERLGELAGEAGSPADGHVVGAEAEGVNLFLHINAFSE